MEKLTQIKMDMDIVSGMIENYDNKPTKVMSARIRKVLGSVKNQVTAVRAALVAADKAGY